MKECITQQNGVAVCRASRVTEEYYMDRKAMIRFYTLLT